MAILARIDNRGTERVIDEAETLAAALRRLGPALLEQNAVRPDVLRALLRVADDLETLAALIELDTGARLEDVA